MSIWLIFILVWVLFFSFMKLVETLSSGFISRNLEKRNITVKFGYISVYTTRFNSAIETYAQSHRKILVRWFCCGALFGLIGLLLSFFLLIFNVQHTIFPARDVPRSVTFRQLPRIPFHSEIPWFLPHAWRSLFTRTDHHPSAVVLPHNASDLSAAAARWGILNKRRPWHKWFLRPLLHGGCHSRHEAFHREVGRLIHVPPWPARRRRRRLRVFRFVKPKLSPLRLRRLLALPPTYDINPNASVDARNASESRDVPHERRSFLTPLVPGVTVPFGDVWYMLIVVLIAAGVHELGHALAAGAEDGHISGIGAFFAVLLPGAYVNLSGIEDMSPRAQLRVYCAGAWHNLVSASLALFAVYTLPMLVAPAYEIGSGALVVNVPHVSPLYGHINPGDVLTRLGPFRVSDGGNSFRETVKQLYVTRDSVGFCVSQHILANESHHASSCCDANQPNDKASPFECFRVQSITQTTEPRKVCLDPGVISSRHTCRFARNCQSGSPTSAGLPACVMPVLPANQQLIDVRVWSASARDYVHFFYEGYLHILSQSLAVSSYIPRLRTHLPVFVLRIIAALDLPNIAERFLQYFASISLGLAILNLAPVLFLDGEATVGLFIRILFKNISMKRVRRIRAAVLLLGSLLLLINLLMSLWHLDSGHIAGKLTG